MGGIRSPLRVDAVDKVGDEQRAGNNRIQVPRFLNLYCAPDSYLDTMARPNRGQRQQALDQPGLFATEPRDH
jgi:hypothetical protein